MKPSVVFVVMPFAERISPSLGVSLIKSALGARGIPARIAYPSLDFARMIGHALYDDIAYGKPRTDALLGEWLFARALDESSPGDSDAYRATLLAECDETFCSAVLGARELVAHFIERCVDDIVDGEPEIVGFTSSFQQHVAALAVAKRVKARAPATTILFGGANCEGAMGRATIANFNFVDIVVSGEGDTVVPELIARRLRGVPIAPSSGVYVRDRAAGPSETTPIERDLDAIPYPDFSDYFACISAAEKEQTRLNFETSRGCWWGEVSHCTFCGLNGSTMTYRKKSPARAADEIEYLSQTYGVRRLAATDNILDSGYFTTLLAELPRRELGVELFYETKSNLRKDHVRRLAEAGVRRVQPGIESLSSPVLALMRKGVTALRNVQTLKWCKAYGLAVTWNLLYGFPGESPADYGTMERLVPLLSHLAPPSYVGRLRLDRFSPMFEDPHSFGIGAIEPAPAYAHVYGLEPKALRELAYYFTFAYDDGREPERYVRGLETACAQWRSTHDLSDLIAIDDGTTTIVCDYRPIAVRALMVLSGFERFIYLTCDEVRSTEQLLSAAHAAQYIDESAAAIEACLTAFAEDRLLVRDGSVALALAVRLETSASAAMLARFRAASTALA